MCARASLMDKNDKVDSYGKFLFLFFAQIMRRCVIMLAVIIAFNEDSDEFFLGAMK